MLHLKQNHLCEYGIGHLQWESQTVSMILVETRELEIKTTDAWPCKNLQLYKL